MNRALLTIVAIVCSTIFTVAQDTLTLSQAIKIGLEKNFSIQLARNSYSIAKNNNTLGNAGMLPWVEANGGWRLSSDETEQTFKSVGTTTDKRDVNNLNGNVQLRWTLFDGFSMFVSKEMLGNLQAMGEQSLQMAIENAVASIVVAYYDVTVQQQLVESIASITKLSHERLFVAKERLAIGDGSSLQVSQAEVDLLSDSTNLLKQRNAVVEAKLYLNQLLGRSPLTPFEVTGTIEAGTLLSTQDMLSQIMQNNRSLAIERLQLSNSQLTIKDIQSGRYPQLSLTSGYNFNKSSYSPGDLESTKSFGPSIGLTASVTLFNGFNVSRSIANARIAAESEAISLEQTEMQLQSQSLSYINSFNLAKMLMQTEQTAVNLAQKNLDIAMEKYKLGSISDIELRDMQNRLIGAQVRYIQAQLQLVNAEVMLQTLSGTIINRFESLLTQE